MTAQPRSEIAALLAPVSEFLQCETADAWIEEASNPEELAIVLTDHFIYEREAYMCNASADHFIFNSSTLPEVFLNRPVV